MPFFDDPFVRLWLWLAAGIAILGVVLGGCARIGTKVTEEQLLMFERGKTSFYDIQAQLGKPNQTVLHSDGSKEIWYTYSQSQLKAINFVPFAAMFSQGATSETTTVHMLFDPQARLVSYTASQGQTTMGTGFQSGGKQ